MRAFLDANILFSAALGGASFALLWRIGQKGEVVLVTSGYCLAEARTNIERKRPQALARFEHLIGAVAIVPEARERWEWARQFVREKDVPVLASAVGCAADVLITGDIADFGGLMNRADLPIFVRTLRALLLGGPKGVR